MTGSVALDVVIGLIFIYLLYSLFATVICEIIAVQLGLRARNLHLAIRRMVEDSPSTSGLKLIAFVKHIGNSIYNFFWLPQGPATCIFYHLPVIKYLGRNTYSSKPSYISKQNFSKAIVEITRRYGGGEGNTDLEKVQNVLAGNLQYEGVLNEIRNKINVEFKNQLNNKNYHPEYSIIRNDISALIGTATKPKDEAQNKLLARIENLLSYKNFFLRARHFFDERKADKAIFYKIDQILNVFGHETRSHLQSLLNDANNDLTKFRLYLEQWFDDTMERAASWYKQKVQFILFLLGLTLAFSFNANTFEIVKKLSVDPDARDKLVQMATTYVSDPNNNPQRGFKMDSTLKTKVDSIWVGQLDSLEKIRVKLQKDMSEANGLLGIGWNLPEELQLIRVDTMRKETDPDSVYTKKLNNLKKIYEAKSRIASIKIRLDSNGIKSSTKREFLVAIPNYLIQDMTLESLQDQIAIHGKPAIKFPSTCYLIEAFKAGFWGYLLTAIAISLGAPFWFDLLNKLIQMRGTVKGASTDQNASTGTTSSDPAQVLNRKG